MKDLMGYCGWDCENCEARLATVNDDDALREKVARHWSGLYGSEITPEMINCSGCRIAGVKTPYSGSMCQIRQCAMGRSYETCADCAELDSCEKIAMVFAHNSEAKSNLKGGG